MDLNRRSSPLCESLFRLRLTAVGRDTEASVFVLSCLESPVLVLVLVHSAFARRHSEQGRYESHLDLLRLHRSQALETRVGKGVD